MKRCSIKILIYKCGILAKLVKVKNFKTIQLQQRLRKLVISQHYLVMPPAR